MAKRGAPLGNTNGTKPNRAWSDAIRMAVARKKKGDNVTIRDLADALIDKCLSGDVSALKEFGDRYEGKVPQAIEGTGPNGAITIITSREDGSVL